MTHLLRLIDKHISLAFVREKLKESYSDTGTGLTSRVHSLTVFLVRAPMNLCKSQFIRHLAS